MARRKKAIPIGVDNFKKIREKDYYYVDKSLLIRDLLDRRSEVTLFTRPRRFGKTLNLSMLRYFFEDAGDEAENTARRQLFAGLQIEEAGEEYLAEQCRYPVISLTLKSAKQESFEMAYICLKETIANEFQRHNYVLTKDVLQAGDRERFIRTQNQKAADGEMKTALAFLSKCLKAYHHQNVIILIDEYDVPLENSYFRHFYQEMVDFIRSLFESALKTNDALEFAVITGCLRISKESIFTGLNHLDVNSIRQAAYAQYFGFTPEEVEQAAAYYGLSGKMDEIRSWYDGYLFGRTEVYNPWSVVKYLSIQSFDDQAFPEPYWSHTSSNDIVRRLIDRADREVKDELEQLIAGGTIEKPVHEDITYEEVYRSQDNLWNFLFFTGYLKKVSERFDGNMVYVTLEIPNEEVRYIYQNSIREWFRDRLEGQDFRELYDCMEAGDAAGMEAVINAQLMGSISFMDSAENFYHGFLTGMLRQSRTYIVKSNREGGNGRGDLFVYSADLDEKAYVLELKASKTARTLEEDAKKAVAQIIDKKYAQGLADLGFRKAEMYGIAFYRKTCRVYYGGETVVSE